MKEKMSKYQNMIGISHIFIEDLSYLNFLFSQMLKKQQN